MRNRCTIVTRIYTSDGLVGECYNGDSDDEQRAICGVLGELATKLVGMSAWNVEACWQSMFSATEDILRDRRVILQAIACIDSALADVIGKATGQPLRRLWGGHHDELPLMVIAGYYSDDPHAIENDVAAFRQLDITACKFKVGGRAPKEDAARVQLLRQLVGESFTIAVDANQAYDLAAAVEFAQLCEGCNLAWFEEPCKWWNDRLAMRDVRMITGVPVSAGQSEVSASGARDLMVTGSIDICNLDASWVGGPTVWRKVAGMASAFGIRMGHHEEPQISGQLLGSISSGGFVECFLPERDPIFWNLITNRGTVRDGLYRLPDDPGWGLTLDEGIVKRYRSD
jgi:L-alanine-DL-glutamate epimerase-like enolase superfamily enzyme